MRNNNKGFTLIEMAMVLVIVGVALGSGLMVFNQYTILSKIDETKARLAEVLEAIDDYVDKYGMLPCPADPTLTFSNASFGVANCSYAGALKSADVSNKVVIGMLPTSTLNIYPSLALDSYGNRISYIVREDATTGSGINAASIDLPLSNYSGSSSYSGVVVIVISHGLNGYGGWIGASGTRINATGGNAQEDENATAGGVFYASANLLLYDDIVYFRTKSQLTDDDFE